MLAAFDLISDLNLEPEDTFNIADKPTSLFCIVSGNISNHTYKIREVLTHLSIIYRGVFFIDGPKDHADLKSYEITISEITKICKNIKNVAYLHSNVVVIDNIALLGLNGWNGCDYNDPIDKELSAHFKMMDLQYFRHSIRKLQKHVDVKHIIVVSGSVPSVDLNFNSADALNIAELTLMLNHDDKNKVKTWLYSGHSGVVDINKFDVRYVSNPYTRDQFWWPRRIELQIS